MIKKHGTGIFLALVLLTTPAFAGVLFKQEINGDYRTCYYRDGSVITTLTLHVSQPCPVND